jgi:hypothetical protein
MRMGCVETFDRDLTEEEKRLCEWIAEQARVGINRVYYDDARAYGGIRGDVQLTRILRGLRERLDGIHNMIESPIVNTPAPFFDVHIDADHIWDGYCHAEEEAIYCESDAFHLHGAMVHC